MAAGMAVALPMIMASWKSLRPRSSLTASWIGASRPPTVRAEKIVSVSSQTTLHLVLRNALGGGPATCSATSTVVIFVSSNADLLARLSFDDV